MILRWKLGNRFQNTAHTKQVQRAEFDRLIELSPNHARGVAGIKSHILKKDLSLNRYKAHTNIKDVALTKSVITGIELYAQFSTEIRRVKNIKSIILMETSSTIVQLIWNGLLRNKMVNTQPKIIYRNMARTITTVNCRIKNFWKLNVYCFLRDQNASHI